MTTLKTTRKMLVPTGITLHHRPLVVEVDPDGWIVLREHRRRRNTAVRIRADTLYIRLVREAVGIRPE